MIVRRVAFFVLALSILSPVAETQGQNGRRPLSLKELVPPSEPAVKPMIAVLGANDRDLDKIDDRLGRELTAAKSMARSVEREAALAKTVRCEAIFSRQITQAQIDAFLGLGGVIDHIYQSVSYGWNGRIATGRLEQLPALLGSDLVAVVAERAVELHMKEATQNGRVRPVWVSGFAGSAAGFSGNANITIGILDTGVDDSHTDLSGRLEYWMDYTTDGEGTPRDIGQHGSHVAGIALGTGAAIGATPTQVLYTDSGDLTGVSSGFFPSPIHIPAGSAILSSTATWLGGGSTTLYAAFSADGASSWGSHGVATGTSPLGNSSSFTAESTRHYSAGLMANGSMTKYAVTNTATYAGVGDGFNALSGVAPLCRLAGGKVFTNAGTGSSLDIQEAVDDMVTQRIAHNIKVVNMSLGIVGSPGLDATLRAKVNTMVNSGIVAVVSAGNDGPGTAPANVVDDPGRAALAITVAAGNAVNQLTEYTSSGFLTPGADEDYKPDLIAPGGSDYYALVLSVDSNDADAESVAFADQRANDYYNIKGTSMAAPFAAGAAALVIDALQQAGVTWDFTSSSHALLVKMLLSATATETNANREVGSGANPPLGRASTPKDRYEGYGLINPDAAIEAVTLTYAGTTVSDSTNGGYYDRRAWARKVSLSSGQAALLSLAVPATADFDLYLYSGTPDAKGNPVILAASAAAGLDADESISYTASATETGYLVVKRVSGSGTWTLNGPTLVDLIAFNAVRQGDDVELTWETGSELDNAGFHLWRAGMENGEYSRITGSLIPAEGGVTQGARYSYVDVNLVGGATWFYKLEDVDLSGASTFHGPIAVGPEVQAITLLSPADAASFRRTPPPVFQWSDSGLDRFQVEFSRRSDFSGGTITLPIAKRKGTAWVSGNAYRPTPSEWAKVSRLFKKASRLYWRVHGTDGSGNASTSEVFRLMMGRNRRR